MATEYYVDGPGNYLGAWPSGHSDIPGGATEVGSAPPINVTQIWGFPNWGAIVPDTVSMAYDHKSSKNSGTISEFNVFGWNSSLTENAYSKISTIIVDNTAGSEDGSLKFETCQAGALVEVLTLEKGITLNGATGGDQGLGSINSTAYHINGGIAIEDGATADQTGAEIKTAYEAEANAYTDTKDTKLGGIEALADVTDTANVTTAGALMDSEVDADLKTLVLPASTTISVFGASLVDDADDSAGRDTLGLVINTDVQAFDANTAKLNVAQEWTKTQNFNATSLVALGSDLVTNGGFAADTDWTKGTGWSIASGVASSDGTQGGDADLTQALSLVNGKTYEVTFTVSGRTAGNVTPVAGDTEGTDRATNATFTENIVAGAGGDIDIRADLDFDGDIDNVTVKLVNVSWDLQSNQVAKITLDGNLVIDNPTNMVDGATYILTLTQDGTGSRTATWGSAFKWPGGTAPTLSTGANDVDIITFVSDGTNMYGVFQGDFS